MTIRIKSSDFFFFLSISLILSPTLLYLTVFHVVLADIGNKKIQDRGKSDGRKSTAQIRREQTFLTGTQTVDLSHKTAPRISTVDFIKPLPNRSTRYPCTLDCNLDISFSISISESETDGGMTHRSVFPTKQYWNRNMSIVSKPLKPSQSISIIYRASFHF